jgi:predicted DNA binding protein
MYFAIQYHGVKDFFEGTLDNSDKTTEVYLFNERLANKIAKGTSEDYDLMTPDDVIDYLKRNKKKFNVQKFVILKTYSEFVDYVCECGEWEELEDECNDDMCDCGCEEDEECDCCK